MLLLSGCVSTPPGASDPAPGDLAPRTEIAWGLDECRFLIGIIRFDPALGEDYLPQGFSFAVGGPGVPVPVPVEQLQRATLGVEGFSCASGHGLTDEVAPVAYGSFYFAVVPPAGSSAGEEAAHYLKHSVLIPDKDRREWFAAAGADVTNGSVIVTDSEAGRTTSMHLEGIGDIRLTAFVTQRYPASDGFRFREFTPARDGLVQWDAVASSPDSFSGRGLIELPEGSMPARLLGSTSGVVDMFGGTFTFGEGKVALPSP